MNRYTPKPFLALRNKSQFHFRYCYPFSYHYNLTVFVHKSGEIMKKLFFTVSILFSILVTSCGSDEKKSTDSDTFIQDSDFETPDNSENDNEAEPDTDSDNTITGDVQLIEFKDEVVVTHPLIFRKNLYVLTKKTIEETKDIDLGGGEISQLPVSNMILTLHAYDISTIEEKWAEQITDYAFGVQNDLAAIGETIAVVSSQAAKPWESLESKEHRRMSFIHYKTGVTFFESGGLSEWDTETCDHKKITKKTNNESSVGDMLIEDGLILFTESGFGVSYCSGKLVFTDINGHWKMTTEPESVVMMNKNIFMFDTQSALSQPYDFISVNIPSAIKRLRLCDVESISFTIPFASSGDYKAVSPFVINDEKIYFTYQKSDLSYYIGVFNQFTGKMIKETELAKDLPALTYGISFRPVIFDDKIVVSNGIDTVGDSRYLVLNLEDFTKTAEIPAYHLDAYSNSLILGGAFYRLKTECVENCDSDYETEHVYSHFIERSSLEDGSYEKIHNELFRKLANKDPLPAFWNAYDGRVFFTRDNMLFILKNQDFTGAKLQKNYNNNGNSLINTEDPASNTNCSNVIPEDSETEDFSSQPAIDEAEHSAADKSEDSQPGLTNLYPDLVDFSEYETAYIPLLKKVYFSSNGETSGTGEGGIKINTQFSCLGDSGCACHEKGNSVKMFYPYKVYAPLHEKDKNNGAPYLTYHPDIPMFYRVFEDMSLKSNRKIFLSYNAYEHDTEDIIDKIENNISDIFDIAVALYTGNYCALVENVLSIAEKELQPVDENYGSPFLTIEKQKENETNVFGIKTDETSGFYTVQGTDEPGDMQAAVGKMHDVTSAVCDLIDIVNDPANPSNFSELDNMSGSVLKDKENSGRYTEGDIEIYRKQLIPVSHITITVDNIETVTPSGIPLKTASIRAGILGEDYTKNEPDDSADTDGTPFISYVKIPAADTSQTVSKVIFDEDIAVNKGLAGIYIETGLSYDDISTFRFIDAGSYSQTFFFEDIFYGSWEREGSTKTFKKSVVKRIKSIESDSYVYLTIEAELN